MRALRPQTKNQTRKISKRVLTGLPRENRTKSAVVRTSIIFPVSLPYSPEVFCPFCVGLIIRIFYWALERNIFHHNILNPPPPPHPLPLSFGFSNVPFSSQQSQNKLWRGHLELGHAIRKRVIMIYNGLDAMNLLSVS